MRHSDHEPVPGRCHDATGADGVEGVEAVGPYQVRFHLNRPWGPFLATLTQTTEIVNEKALQAKDPKLFPVGTGPYRFVEWVKDDHVTLERWDKYFRPSQPYIDRIIFNAPADDTVRLTGLQTGRFNWIQTVPPQRIPELERARDMKSSPGRPYFPFFFMLNASRPPLGDKRIRQAISWALDRSEIVKLVYYGSHVVTAEPTPEPSPWATGVNAHKGGPDLARAKQLLSDAGIGSGLVITPNVTLDFAVNPDFAQVESDQLVVTANQRFPIFFAEKRPFFLEGIDIFQTQIQAVHTRTIIDPDFAVKLTGVTAPAVRPLDSVREEVKEGFITEARSTRSASSAMKSRSTVQR